MKTAKSTRAERSAVASPTLGKTPHVTSGVAAAVYFGLAVVYFLPAFLPGHHIYGTDYLVGGYFFHEFISQRFAEGVLPKWVPYVYGGLPLLANPGSTFYPFRFLADALFHTSRIWPTLFVIHFFLAGWGTYFLARELGARPWVAFVGGLAFQFTGLTMSWVLAGHEGRIIVATLAPFVFYFYHRGIRTGEVACFVGAAAAIGFSLLSFQIQVAYYVLVGAAVWSGFGIWHLGAYARGKYLLRTLILGLGSVAFGFALASVNFLPFLNYIDASPRGGATGRGYEYSVTWSMPPAEIVSIAVPEAVGYLESYQGGNPFKLHVEYVGMTVVVLLALGFAVSRRNRYWWFFAALAVFALTIAFGGHTPIYRLYYEMLPGTYRFRAPSISFFLVSFSLVMMATLSLEALASLRERRPGVKAPEVREGVLLGILVTVVGLVALGFVLNAGGLDGADPISRSRAVGYARTLFFSAVVAAVLWAWFKQRLITGALVVLLSAATVVDLWIVDRKFFSTVPTPEVMFAADDVVRFLLAQPGHARVWVLPFPGGAVYRGPPGNYLMRFGIDQVGGEHGNQLQRYNEYLGAGEEVYVDWHNFLAETGVVQTAGGQALAFRSTPGFLEAANVRFIISMVPLAHPDLREVHRGSALVYEHAGALPRAYLVPEVETIGVDESALPRMRTDWDPRRRAVVATDRPLDLPGGDVQGAVELLEYEPDRVVVRTHQSAAALLVLADNYYSPGWRVHVNGEELEVLRTNHTFRGVPLSAGENTVIFTFEPMAVRVGFLIYLSGLVLLFLYGGYLLIAHRRRSGSVRTQ